MQNGRWCFNLILFLKFEGSFLIVKPTNYSIYWSCQYCAFEGFNGIKIGEYSKSSCQTITKIESMGRCPGTFFILMDRMALAATINQQKHASVAAILLQMRSLHQIKRRMFMTYVSKMFTKVDLILKIYMLNCLCLWIKYVTYSPLKFIN